MATIGAPVIVPSPSRASVRLFDDPTALGEALADEILARYAGSDGPFLLGCKGRDTCERLELAGRRARITACLSDAGGRVV